MKVGGLLYREKYTKSFDAQATPYNKDGGIENVNVVKMQVVGSNRVPVHRHEFSKHCGTPTLDRDNENCAKSTPERGHCCVTGKDQPQKQRRGVSDYNALTMITVILWHVMRYLSVEGQVLILM